VVTDHEAFPNRNIGGFFLKSVRSWLCQSRQAPGAAKPLERFRSGQGSDLIEVGGKTAYWLELVHPTASGGAYVREREDWPRLFSQVQNWIETQNVVTGH
jgi:hypothetical protein